MELIHISNNMLAQPLNLCFVGSEHKWTDLLGQPLNCFFFKVSLNEMVGRCGHDPTIEPPKVWVFLNSNLDAYRLVLVMLISFFSKIFLHLLTLMFTSTENRCFDTCLFERNYSTLGEYYKEQHVYLITDPRTPESNVTCMALDKL